jgi:ubiquinone/menaquinone biosynthesis C-methylase UbiE
MNKKIARYFVPERIPWFAAPLYDKLARGALESYYSRIAEEIIAHGDCGLILDIGTGPGYLPIQLVKMAPNIGVEGIDLSAKLIKIAHGNAEKAGVSDRLNFRVGNGNRIDAPDDTYTMVISTGSLHAWRHPVKVMDECRRVLIQGGEAWIYDPAKITLGDNRERDSGSSKALDRLGYLWASLTGKAVKPYSIEEIREFAKRSRFDTFTLESSEWLKLRLIT